MKDKYDEIYENIEDQELDEIREEDIELVKALLSKHGFNKVKKMVEVAIKEIKRSGKPFSPKSSRTLEI